MSDRHIRLSAKVKDVPQLDDGSNPSLVQWQVLLKSKLTANADHFPTESDKKTHVFACTTGKAATLLETAMEAEDDPEEAFPDWEAMVDYLVTSLRNPHERADARFAYKELQMHPNESFFDFKLKFLQYATRGKVAKSEWKDDMYDKLTRTLQDEMRIEVQKIKDFNEFADLTSGTDARLRRDRAQNPPAKAIARVRTTLRHPTMSSSPPTTQLARASVAPGLLPRQYSAPPSRPKQTTEPRETTAPTPSTVTCYNCGEPGHTRPECPYPRRDANLNEIVQQEDDNESDVEEIQRAENPDVSGNGDA